VAAASSAKLGLGRVEVGGERVGGERWGGREGKRDRVDQEKWEREDEKERRGMEGGRLGDERGG